MKQDKNITEVIFLMELPESDMPVNVFAFFPKENANNIFNEMKICYSHIGQHSQCSLDYAKECKAASESEYLPLKQELESIGYNLKITTL